ncbi:hypothetical protein D9M70_630790 [compost metagenome]
MQTSERPRRAAVRPDAPSSTEPEQAPEVQPVHLAQAEAVVQSGGIELPIEKVAEIFARKDSGQSQNEIAGAKVANKRTVSKVLTRREELSTDAEPALA